MYAIPCVSVKKFKKLNTGGQYFIFVRQVDVRTLRSPAPGMGSNRLVFVLIGCRTLTGRVRARVCVWSLFSIFSAATNKPSFSDGYSPLLLRRGQTLSGEQKRQISYLKSRNSTREQENVHKPGGRKGCPYFKVTMEVPGMQVS